MTDKPRITDDDFLGMGDYRPDMDQYDLETSDYGRDPRFPLAWYIVPVLIIGVGLIGLGAWLALAYF